MNRHCTSFLAALFLTPLAASFGCSDAPSGDAEEQTSSSSASLANGWTRQLSNEGGSLRYALGATAHIHVTDSATGPQTCTNAGTEGCNGPSCTTPPTRHTQSTVQSVVCDGGCTAAITTMGTGSFTIDVTSAAPGTSTVTVSLADSSGVVLSTSASIVTARPTSVTLVRSNAVAPNGTAYAVLPGAAFEWCAGLADASGPLFFADKDLAFGILGATRDDDAQPQDPEQSQRERCVGFDAVTPGDIVFRVSNPSVERVETVHVIAPADVVRAELLVEQAPFVVADHAPLEQDPLDGFVVASEVVMDSCSGNETLFAVRVFTNDGHVALAPSSSLAVSPTELLSLGNVPAVVELLGVETSASGQGTISATIGEVSLSVPLVVTGPCGEPIATADAGATDGGLEEDAAPDAGP